MFREKHFILRTHLNCKNTAGRSYSLASCFKFEMRLETTILVIVFFGSLQYFSTDPIHHNQTET